MTLAPPSSRLPIYDARDYDQRHMPAATSWKRTGLGSDPFEHSSELPSGWIPQRIDDTSHLAIVPPVDRNGAFRREDHARAVLATIAALVSGAAVLGVLWALVRLWLR